MTAVDSLPPSLPCAWTFGGGTALRIAYAHRISKDIDIFLTDATILGALSPRLNDVTDAMTADYTEQSNFLKLRFAEGEVDFIIGARLLPGVPLVETTIDGRAVAMESPLEIVAKKCFYRAADFTTRDVFDLAAALANDRAGIDEHPDVFLAKRAALDARLAMLAGASAVRSRFEAELRALAIAPEYERVRNTALTDVRAYLASAGTEPS